MKGLIVAAGYGTRFLPVTKSVPKEMLPLITKPSISFIIEEFINSGIDEIVIITSRRKKSLEDFLDRDAELEALFTREGAEEKLAVIAPYPARFSFVRQTDMLGTGHALLQAEPLLRDGPFVIAYPDDIHFGEIPLAKQLVDLYQKTGPSVLATLHDPPDLHRYGVLELDADGLHVRDIVEKPSPGTEPSREASIGRYLCTPELFEHLRRGWDLHLRNREKGEYFHIYALKKLMEQNKVVYKRTEGERLDTGAPEGYLRAILRYASEFPEYRRVAEEEVRRFPPAPGGSIG